MTKHPILDKHPLPWKEGIIGIFSDANGNVVVFGPTDIEPLKVTKFMVDAVNRLYGPPICAKCDKPSGGRLGHWCDPCMDAHVKDLQGDIHLYQSAEKRADREAEFNKDT